MAEKKPIDLSMPLRGYDENWAYKAQPEGTSPGCLNVRPYDVLGQRLRGGQRAGLSKYVATPPNGTNPIQMIVQEPTPASGYTESFPYPDGTVFDSVGAPWRHYDFGFTWIGSATGTIPLFAWATGRVYAVGDQVTAGAARFICKAPHTSTTGGLHPTPPGNVTDWWNYAAATTPPKWITGHLFTVGDLAVESSIVYRCLTTHTSTTFATDFANGDWEVLDVIEWVPSRIYAVGDQVVYAGDSYVCIVANHDTAFTGSKWAIFNTPTAPAKVQGGAYRATDSTPNTADVNINQFATPTGDMTVGMTVTKVGSVDGSGFFGLFFRVSSDAATGYLLQYFPATTTGNPILDLFDQTGTQLFGITVTGYPQSWTVDPTASGAAPGQTTPDTPVRVVVTAVGQDVSVYLNGVLVGRALGVLTNTTGTRAGFLAYPAMDAGHVFDITDFSIAGVANTAGGGARILVCSAGSVYSGAVSSTWQFVATDFNTTGIVRAQTAFGKMYLTDGLAAHYRVYDPGSRTMTAWVPTPPGLLPTGVADPSLGATLIALYRGRIVLSGIADDPQNWFMSAAGDPLNWAYGATPSATMAVAGNNSVAGLVGDRITCLAPANDDLMVIGGDHTIWIMRGDPADGGRIDNVSHTTGIAGPDVFAFDPQAVMYFFGNGILWRLTSNGELTPISRGRLDKTFGAIDLVTNNMRLLWDKVRHGLHIFVTPIISGAGTHYFWDARTNSFWPESYPNDHGPTAVLDFDANAPTDQAILLGGQDGYVRKIDASSVTDDGTTILSRVKFPPISVGSVYANGRFSRLTTILGSSSSPVDLRVYAVQSPELVVAATTPVWARTITPLDRYAIPRINANSLMLELKNDSFSTAWMTGTDYVVGSQVVAADGVPYVSRTIHHSGAGHASPTAGGNPTDWTASTFRTWALESVSAILETTGRTRHGRL